LLISHLPLAEPPQGPLAILLEQRAMGQMPPVVQRRPGWRRYQLFGIGTAHFHHDHR
jgi:hypothetical protein